ncbi:DUF3021 family protein [Lysinibacillus endophyticus]|uniref:DUF3021 family protein n=1 Tax=Ureibacillus endophyticus TaxID=1978490 RepID=A0A494YYM4_9BACL|nr:DUF3021 family protein [Lysinibacillus endophyticus]MCP1146571.1 DUF3021 domain-containing protein [Lysinibacillus endophyticus]RKQ15311.1 DUF3021 family protein [Lysinibacillus endophyticus]
MQLSEFIKKVLQQFLIIFALIIIILTFLRQLYYPEASFDLKSIYIVMAFSFFASLLGFILYSPNNLSEKNSRIRMVIHFLALEALLITLASITGIVDSVISKSILAIQIAVIYCIVRLLSWQQDKKVSNEINEKLHLLRKSLEE